MNDPAAARLRNLLGGDDLAALRRRLRRRFEQAPLDGPIEQIRIDKLTREEHSALASLLGRPQRYASSLQFDVHIVDAALRRAGIAASLREALEKIDGPIVHLAAARLRLQTHWSQVVGGCGHVGLAGLLGTAAGLGLLKRLGRQPSAAAELCRRAEAVLRRLPAHGATRAQLAADTLGDAHALDGGQATATLVLAVLRRAHGEAGAEPTSDAERDRDVWAAAGVLVNELARPALFLNLPADGTRSTGEPGYASLRTLLRAPPTWQVANRDVHICENPNLIAIAADHWGADCAPLVCTDGMPGAAQRRLLSQLARAGARLHYHGDFDWPGLRIANHVMRAYGAEPWRFGAADYGAAVSAAAGLSSALYGNAVEASWDGTLARVMQQTGIAVAEEAVSGALMQDLGTRQ